MKTAITIVAFVTLLVGCGSVTPLNAPPFVRWNGQQYPVLSDMHLLAIDPGVAKGESHYILSADKTADAVALIPQGTAIRVLRSELRSRVIGMPHFVVVVEVPFNASVVTADIYIDTNSPIALEWPHSRK